MLEVCVKVEGCTPLGEWGVINLEINSSDNCKVINGKVDCSTCGMTVKKHVPFKEEKSAVHEYIKAIRDKSATAIGLIKAFVVICELLKKANKGVNCRGESYFFIESETFKALDLWLVHSEAHVVPLALSEECDVRIKEENTLIKYEHLHASLRKTKVTGNDIFQTSALFNVILKRDMEAVFDSDMIVEVNASTATKQELIEILNESYFSHNNPLHEIQWIIGALINKDEKIVGVDGIKLLRLAVHHLVRFREGTTNKAFQIAKYN